MLLRRAHKEPVGDEVRVRDWERPAPGTIMQKVGAAVWRKLRRAGGEGRGSRCGECVGRERRCDVEEDGHEQVEVL